MSHTEWTLHYTPSQRAAELLDGALRSFQVQLGLLAFSEEIKEAGPCTLPTFPPHLFTCCWHQCSSTTAWGQTAAPSCTLWSLAPAALSQDQLPAPRTQPRCPQPNRDLGRDELRSQSLLSCTLQAATAPSALTAGSAAPQVSSKACLMGATAECVAGHTGTGETLGTGC